MQSKNNAPNAAQKAFRENLRDLYPGSEIHHCVGSTGKHNKVEIGHWWILAIPEKTHKKLHSGEYGKNRKLREKTEFREQMDVYFNAYFRMPVPDEVLEAIEGFHL